MNGFMKWNCYDLAEQIEVFERCKKELNGMYEELTRLTREADAVESEKFDRIRKLITDLSESIHRLNVDENHLEQAIDIYFAAETQARMQAESLPTSTRNATVVISGTAAATGNAVMEDWLAALAFQQGQ